MGILDVELEKFSKGKKFERLCRQLFKGENITGSVKANIAQKQNAQNAAARFKQILEEEISNVQKNDPRIKNPLVGADAIIVGKPKIVQTKDTISYGIIVSLNGASTHKESISPKSNGLNNVLILYDTGYSHPIMGRLPYKVINGEVVAARRNISPTGFIEKAIERFNSENIGFAIATRE